MLNLAIVLSMVLLVATPAFTQPPYHPGSPQVTAPNQQGIESKGYISQPHSGFVTPQTRGYIGGTTPWNLQNPNIGAYAAPFDGSIGTDQHGRRHRDRDQGQPENEIYNYPDSGEFAPE